MNEFFLTLISNSTSDIHPSNNSSSFVVELPRKIVLGEEAVVGLAEIQFPYNFFNVTNDSNLFSFVHGDFSHTDNIPAGFYNSVSELIEQILKKTREHFGEWIQLDRLTNRCRIIKTDKFVAPHPKSKDRQESRRWFCFYGRLATQLGFAPNENLFNYELSPYVGNIGFGIPEQMMVYCDLIEPQMIGYESSQVIKVINTTESEAKFGTPCYRGFHKIHYIPVLRKQFDSVEINIRDITGENFPFRHGIVLVKLHFKEKKIKNNTYYWHGE